MKKTDLQELVNLVVENTLAEDGRLRDIFLQPAKDVVKTAGYAAERISGAAQTLVKGLSYILPTIIVPGLEFDYNTFAKDEAVKMNQIKQKYGDVLNRNWEAIKDPDVFGFMLLAYPQAMLGFALMKKSPLAFLHLLEVVTGGNASVSQLRQSIEGSAAYAPRQRVNQDPSGGSWTAAMGPDMLDGGGFGESLVREAADPVTIQKIQALMQQPQIQQALQNSQMFKDMQAAAVQIMVAPVARFMRLQTLDQMKGIIRPDAIDKAKQAVMSKPEYQKLDEPGKQAVVAQLVQQIKATYKQETIKLLQGLVAKTPQAAPQVQRAVAQITALK